MVSPAVLIRPRPVESGDAEMLGHEASVTFRDMGGRAMMFRESGAWWCIRRWMTNALASDRLRDRVPAR